MNKTSDFSSVFLYWWKNNTVGKLWSLMNSFLKFKYVFLLGDWWVHRPSQRKRLWDHGEFWKARVEFGSNCCSDSSCKGKCLLALIALELDIEQCNCTEDLPLLNKRMNSASVLKTWDTIKGLQPSPPHTTFVGFVCVRWLVVISWMMGISLL